MKDGQGPSSTQLVNRRKLTVGSVIGVTFLFLFLFNVAAYWFMDQIGDFLKDELDARLRSTAQMAQGLLEPTLNNVYDPDEQTLLQIHLERLRIQNDLESAYIINAGLEVLADARPELENISRGYLVQDSTSLQAIEMGDIAVSPLHLVQGHFFKNAYAPLYDLFGNTSILVLEANAHSFNILRFYRNGLYAGTFISIVVLLLIISYVTWATRLLVKTESQLHQSQRLAAMGQMTATVAHEIRNPLGIIKSTSDVLREKYQSPNQPDELFEFINEEIGRLNRLVNDFLSFAREPQLDMAQHDLTGIINNAIHAFTSENTDQVDIVTQLPTTPMWVMGDRDYLHRVLLNLLLNARQAVEGKRAEINIHAGTETHRGKSYYRINIADNGHGIAGDPNAIFEPFFTTKTRGTGLGMAVCKNIIERHGGAIIAENSKNGGAVVGFTLPQIKPKSVDKGTPNE